MRVFPEADAVARRMAQEAISFDTCRQWFAVRTKPNREDEACRNFGNQKLSCYLPCTIVQRKHARRIEKVRRPFFSGYLFLHLAQSEQDWTAIRSTRGALGAVRFGDVYPPVPDALIEAMRAREDERGFISLSRSLFLPGQPVKVEMEGQTEMEAVFLDMKGEDRALLLVNFLRRQVRVVVSLAAIQSE